MNSYVLGISGSWWLLILLFITAAGFAVFTYKRTLPPIPKARKYILIALRTIAFTLLLFVLFEPVLTIITGTELPPRLALLLDNSLSTAQTDAKGDRKAAYELAVENSGVEALSENELQPYLFDADTRLLDKLDIKRINHKGQLTDISKALRTASQNIEKDNIQAVLLISDGAFNAGNNPIYDADMLGKPVFVIGIGDSTEPKDVGVQSILTNEITYIGNPVPVNVNVSVTGYGEGNLRLELLDNGNNIAEQSFSINTEKQSFTAVFEYKPKQEGIHKLTANISSLPDEITLKNNTLSEFVNVVKNKRKVAIFAGAPSPDLSFIRNALTKDKGVEISAFIQKKGAEFYDKIPSSAEIRQSELIILIGFPISSTPENIIQLIKYELDKGKPLIFVASQQTDYNKLRMLENYLPFKTVSSNPQEFMALPDFKSQAISSPLLRITGAETDLTAWNQLPPLYRTETFIRVKPESEVLSTIKVNNVPLNEPLIVSRSLQNYKSVAILGYGIYRWKLLGYGADIAKGQRESADLFESFMLNSLKWLSANQDNKQISIKTIKKRYTNAEKVEFIAQVYDAAYTPIDNANIMVKIGGGIQQRQLILNSQGNGRYYGQIDGLPEGDYYFTGEVKVNGANIGEDKGRFSIGEIALEYQNLRMNASLLRNIAERTGGKFYTVNDVDSFINDLKNIPGYTHKAITIRSEFALWNLPYLLAIAILCFSAEWFMRKRSGMI